METLNGEFKMSKKLLIFLLVIQAMSIVLILSFGIYLYNDTIVFSDMVKRNVAICYEKLSTYGEDVIQHKNNNFTYVDLVSCMEKLKKYEEPTLILKF